MCLFLVFDNLVSERKVVTYFRRVLHGLCPSQWQRGLRHGSADVRVLELLVPIPPGAWIVSLVSVVCCRVLVVSATGLSLVQRSPTEYGVSECDREDSTMRRLWPTRG
jgi:hypothetical protein